MMQRVLQAARGCLFVGVLVASSVLGTGTAFATVNDYQFVSGFSSTQGANQWFYKQWNGSSYSDMGWDGASNYWRGSCTYCIITQGWQHPDANDSVIAWQAPRAGTVAVRGTMDHHILNSASDGVQTKIMKQSGATLSQVWPSSGYQDIPPNFMAQHIFKTYVAAGDMLYFHLNQKATNAYDTTSWNPRITYGYEPQYFLDKAELAMSPANFAAIGENVAMDSSLSVVPNGTNLDFYHSSQFGSLTQKFKGSLAQPAGQSVYSKYNFTDTYNPGGEHWWINNIYKTTDGKLLAFTHIENADVNTTGWWALGLAYSTDGGNTFTKLGKIVLPNVPDRQNPGQSNIYGLPYVIKDGYFYVYYGEPAPAVARASVASVLAAAASGTVSTWNKYYSGTWTQPALGGNYTTVIPPSAANDYATHGDAAYSTYLNKYLLSGYTHSGGKGVFLTFSDDGTNYETPTWVQQSTDLNKPVLVPYETIVNEDGTDNGQVGQNFYLYYNYRYNQNDSSTFRWMYRQKVTLNLAGFNKTVYNGSLDFAANQGENSWRYYEYNSGAYSEMHWDASQARWQGTPPSTLVGAEYQYPDTNESVRAWVAPSAGWVTISADSGQISVAGGPGADGVNVKVAKNGVNVWPLSGYQTIAPGTAALFPATAIDVAKGDILYFHVNRNGNNAYDTTNWIPIISYPQFTALPPAPTRPPSPSPVPPMPPRRR